jgi:membrane-bound metal-dependent hydrolase YbcI (DUF457 family)
MPSPVGHALGGLAVAFVVDAFARHPRLTWPLLAAATALAVSPDLDLLAGSHRTYSHSVGAVAIVGAACWLFLRARHASSGAVLLTAAYASHLPLDWLSKDTRAPSGLTALWPLTLEYYQSAWTVFGETSRRYWLPEEFIVSNLKEAMLEFTVMFPLLLIAWIFWSKRTLR